MEFRIKKTIFNDFPKNSYSVNKISALLFF